MAENIYVEETSDDLLYSAETDVIAAYSLMGRKYYPPDLMYNQICFHATSGC